MGRGAEKRCQDYLGCAKRFNGAHFKLLLVIPLVLTYLFPRSSNSSLCPLLIKHVLHAWICLDLPI